MVVEYEDEEEEDDDHDDDDDDENGRKYYCNGMVIKDKLRSSTFTRLCRGCRIGVNRAKRYEVLMTCFTNP